jgi:methylthioxylose transferase
MSRSPVGTQRRAYETVNGRGQHEPEARLDAIMGSMASGEPERQAVADVSIEPDQPWTARWVQFRLVGVVLTSVGILVFGFEVGTRLNRERPEIKLGAGPLVGSWDVRPTLALVIPAFIAALVAWWWPRSSGGWSSRRLLVFTGLATAAFTFSLAASHGRTHLLDPIVHPTEYWHGLPNAGTMSYFVDSYVERLPYKSVHLRGHPPGFTVLLLSMRIVGLPSAWWAGAVSWISAGLLPVAVLATLIVLGRRALANRVAPFLVVAPYAVWAGTSADVVYAALLATSVAGVAGAVRTGRWRWALGGGLAFGLVMFGTYGVGAMAPLLGAAALDASVAGSRLRDVWRERSAVVRRLVCVAGIAGVVVGVQVLVWAWAGFWWWDGFEATKGHYWRGTAQFRDWGPFTIFNLGATLVAIGPAVVVALARLRRGDGGWLVVGAWTAIAVACLSEYSKGEVERIWLLVFPWITIAAGGWWTTTNRLRLAIAVQAALTLFLELALVTKW